MSTMRRFLSAMLVFAMVVSMGAMMAGCGSEEAPAESTAEVSGENSTYTIHVKTRGEMPLSGIDVYVYADDTLSDLKQYGATDENGTVSVTMPRSDSYAVALSGVPKGYDVAASYSFSGTICEIYLKSELISGESLSGAKLGLGDVMYDFSVAAPSGETITLSEMLSEKDMVMLNFWYSTCGPCANEFPYMEEVYQMYQENVGIIALNPLEDNTVVASYQQTMGLSFPMAACQAAWSTTFGLEGYPTSIVIDRYGVICMVEVGSVTSLSPFVSAFEHFTGNDYEQTLCPNGMADLVTAIRPTSTMPASEEIVAAINQAGIEVTYRAEEGESAEYCWPFVLGEKNGETCVYASNQGIEDSYAIVYADVTLKAGQAIGFDYLISSELGADAFVVIVDGEDIFQMSGYNEVEVWEKCYPWVAEEDGTYEVALCYLKDESDNAGDDTVYIKNMRIVDEADIDTATYLPRQAASTEDGFEYDYVELVLNEKDGYYHVGSENGPLLLANMQGYSEFSEEQTLWDICYDGAGSKYYEDMVNYFSYASNSAYNGYCTVNEELAHYLKLIDEVAGFDKEDDSEWLRFCMYYEQYGTDEPLADPIKGLSPASAYEAKMGETNSFYYNRVIMPRGLLARFVPSKSGVYRITSSNESNDGVDGWIFDENRTELLVYEQDERLFNDSNEVSMVMYMEKGKAYYIDIAFWDPYEVGTIYYDIEYVGSKLEHFRLCAPGYFTYDSDATGDAMYYLISGGIDVVLGDDGIYYEDLGDGRKGSKIYCDFTGMTSVFSSPIATVNAYNADGTLQKDENGDPVMIKGMIELGGFDFSKTEDDLYILGIMKAQDNDIEKTKEYLKTLWGEDYDSYAEIYQLDDVFAGRYHGKGEDLTAEMEGYLDKIITKGGEERRGCVVVDQRLAEILQMLMDKYTFANVENSWIKICYYYDYLGPEG